VDCWEMWLCIVWSGLLGDVAVYCVKWTVGRCGCILCQVLGSMCTVHRAEWNWIIQINYTLPEDCCQTETCRSNFNVNFNVLLSKYRAHPLVKIKKTLISTLMSQRILPPSSRYSIKSCWENIGRYQNWVKKAGLKLGQWEVRSKLLLSTLRPVGPE
jgi:hypothetical protein